MVESVHRAAKEFAAQLSKRQVLPRFLQAGPLKRSEEIVGESNDFQVQSVSRKRCRGDLSKREVFAQFADARLHAGTAIIRNANCLVESDAYWPPRHDTRSALA